MTPLTLAQIGVATGARLINADPSALVQSICTDTRKIQPGCLFIAIRGENHDGHDHVEKAAAGGAVAAMVQTDCPAVVPASLPILKVPDTRRAMGQLAADVRRNLRGTVIAVAGSNGKTGTKHLIDAALAGSRTGTISPKSFNNDIGVPLTIFDANPAHDYLVLEVGTNHPGEILNLTKIAQPDVAVITNIGAEHLEFLGDIDGVVAENAQIIDSLNPNGLLLINGDPIASETRHKSSATSAIAGGGSPGSNPTTGASAPGYQAKIRGQSLDEAVRSYSGQIVTFGFGPHNNLHPTDIECGLDGVRFRFNGLPIFIPQLGRHTAANALAAIAVATHLGVSTSSIIAGLAAAKGPEMRLQLQTAGSIRILNDAYNANPHSMMAGLQTLRDIAAAGRKVAILGDMRELGETADRYHREIGEFAGACGLDLLICVGEKSALMADAARTAGLKVEHYPTAADCAADISSIVTDGDLVLTKASRGMKLETVANAILAHTAQPALSHEVAARMQSVLSLDRVGIAITP